VRLAVVVGMHVCFPWRVRPMLRWCVVFLWCRRQSVHAVPRATTAGTCSGVPRAKMRLSSEGGTTNEESLSDSSAGPRVITDFFCSLHLSKGLL